MVNSINTNISAYYAQVNIGLASQSASASVQRLSSGNRIVKASDDVAALATGTSLRTQVATLKSALTNTAQGSSLLQVADGALSQITDILQRQKAIALQAGSGSLQNSDRVFLNQEFQALTAEINRLSGSTTFNGVQLINGALSDTVGVTNNSTNATAGEMSVIFNAGLVPAAGDTLAINGVTLTLRASPSTAGEVQLGGTLSETLDNVVAYLNGAQNSTSSNALIASDKLKVSKASYARSGSNTLVITARTGGDLASFFRASNTAVATGTWAGTAGTTGVRVSGHGLEKVTVSGNTINISNIDTDATIGTANGFAASGGVLTYDGTTIYTIVDGDSLRTIVNGINANTSTTGISAFITGKSGAYTLNVRSENSAATGTLAGTGLGSLTSGAATANNIASFAGAGKTGLGQASTIGVGTTGGSFSLLTDQTQQVAKSVITFPEIAAGDLTSTSNFGTARDITIEGVVFTFTQTAKTAKSQTEITIGSSLQETLDNAVEAINSFAGSEPANYAFRQIQARRDGNSVVIESKQVGNALDISANTLTVATSSSITGTSVSSADLSNTSNTGIDTSGVMNSSFVGKIQGFTASYTGTADTIDISIVVGGKTYTAKNVDSTPTSNTTARFISETGGYFDVLLRANQGVSVTDSASAADFAKKLDAAFSGVTFYQRRDVTSYNATGSLIGSSVKMQLDNFSDVKVSDIKVLAPSGTNINASINITVNGEVYSSLTGLGSQLGAFSVTRFVSASDPSKFIEFHNGATALDMSDSTAAATLESNLKTAFGVGTGAGALSFQIGATATDTLAVSIGNATTSNLFGGQSLDVLSQASAATASAVLDTALGTVTSLRATVGALQSRFNFAAANIQISIQNQDASRGELLDTDIASESTNYATAQVKLQAGISVLAQANQQLQALLKLIG